jgi:SP family galactose:H+ symporter-like MFS transporter
MKKTLFFPLAVAFFFGMLLSYPISVSSGVLIFLEKDFLMTALTKSLVVSVVIVGAMVGILAGGPVADRFGRKKAILLSALFLIIGSFASALASSYKDLLLFRFITGAGIGITSMCIPVYLAEMSEPEYRGKMVSIFQVSITIGIFVSYLVNYALISSQSWRMAFGISGLLAVFGFLITLKANESRAWLEEKSQTKLNQNPYLFKSIFKKSLRKVLFLGLTISIFQQITGINAVIFYAPEIFMRAGVTDMKGNLFLTLLMGLFNVATALFTMTRIDGWGRRKLLLLGIPGMILSLTILGFFSHTKAFAIFGLFFYILSFGISLGPVAWVMISEIYPIENRATLVSFTLLLNWIASLAVSFSFLFLIEYMGVGKAFNLFSFISVLALFFVYFKVPETKGKSLKEIEEFWA